MKIINGRTMSGVPIYLCDPRKNRKCEKGRCQSECFQTFDKKYAYTIKNYKKSQHIETDKRLDELKNIALKVNGNVERLIDRHDGHRYEDRFIFKYTFIALVAISLVLSIASVAIHQSIG